MALKRVGKGDGKQRKKAPAKRTTSRAPGIEFNHAMIYTADYPRALEFYRDRLGFKLLDEYPGAYARLQSPGSRTTIALHCLEKDQRMDAAREGIRLYFEIKPLDTFCKRLAATGVLLDQMPKPMPWGWRHAYLRDPDGHELSLYWAGQKRLRRTTKQGSR